MLDAVRQPVCADDRWYPSDRQQLEKVIRAMLERATPRLLEGELIGLIVPHAGIQFSGPTAAYAYKLLQGRSWARVVAIGPSHFDDFGAVATSDKDFFATPLGRVPLDRPFLDLLSKKLDLRTFHEDHEHSLEIQLPFLQLCLGTFELVPLLMSRPFYVFGLSARAPTERVSAVLTPMLRGSETLLLASSDLSHLHDYDSVVYFDRRLEMLVEEFDLGGMVDFMANEEQEARACGDVAIVTVLQTARELGANRVTVLHRTNSGDVTGRRAPGVYTVGYMAAAITRVAAPLPH